jgi:hypothetical protein
MPRFGWRRCAFVLLLALLALGSLTLPRGASADATDRSATHAYLLALLAAGQEIGAGFPAARLEIEHIAAGVGGECPGVLGSVPVQDDEPPSRSPGERERGEQERQQRQLSALQLELSETLLSPSIRLGTEATTRFLAQVGSLHWDDPLVNRRVAHLLSSLAPEATSSQIDFCADMATWLQSGYRRVSPATRALLQPSDAIELFRYVEAPSLQPLGQLLRRYESRADRALAKRIEALDRKLAQKAARSISPVDRRLRSKLGEKPPVPPRPLAGHSKLLAHGRTADGKRFEVRVGKSSFRGCRYSLVLSAGNSTEVSCTSNAGLPPRVNCQEGELIITGSTRPRTRRVRLLLSNGHSIESSVALIPRRLGGPTGVYYQSLRGPAPIPVSLVELDAHGSTVRVLRLNRIHGCTTHPFKRLPPGRTTLARGSVPDSGPSFTIVGERYRLLGHTHVGFHLGLSSLSPALNALLESAPPFPAFSRGAAAFTHEESTECEPHPYEIVYGLLDDPRDTVLARTSEGLVPLASVQLPPAFHTTGALAYGAFSPPPTELVVRNAAGKEIAHESLAESARNQLEFCEGYAEPSS